MAEHDVLHGCMGLFQGHTSFGRLLLAFNNVAYNIAVDCCSQTYEYDNFTAGWVMSLARGAKNNGAKIFEKCAVTGIDAGN